MKRGLRALGHPVHPMLSDFPLVLLTAALLWDLVALFTGDASFWKLSFWSNVGGVSMAVPAAIAGLIDWAAIPEGDPAVVTGIWHMSVMLTAVGCYGASLLVRGGTGVPSHGAMIGSLALEAIGMLALGLGGWFGGHLVFRHGIGVDER